MAWPLVAGLAYEAMNLPFAVKYGVRAGVPAPIAVAAYVAFATLLLVLGPRVARALARRAHPGRLFAAAVAIAAALLAIAMRRFDPDLIRVTRAPAIHDWIERLLRGEFPYASEVMPSSFPGLFALALPFDRLGDVGLLQIAAFVVFAALCWRVARPDPARAWWTVALLVGSPLFVYEVVTRSELFSNMTVVLLVVAGLQRRPLPLGAWGLGLLAGLALSTRGIVGLVYALLVPWRFRHDPRAGGAFTLAAAAAFVATWLPFALWRPERFSRSGPFAIQSSYAPAPLLFACLVLAVALGLGARSAEAALRSVALLLFGLVAVLLASAVVPHGVSGVLLGDRFDISYFAFAQTFLLYGVARGVWSRGGAAGLTPEWGR